MNPFQTGRWIARWIMDEDPRYAPGTFLVRTSAAYSSIGNTIPFGSGSAFLDANSACAFLCSLVEAMLHEDSGRWRTWALADADGAEGSPG
jgi:hypothetical protein